MEGYLNYPGRVREGFLQEVTPALSPQNRGVRKAKAGTEAFQAVWIIKVTYSLNSKACAGNSAR